LAPVRAGFTTPVGEQQRIKDGIRVALVAGSAIRYIHAAAGRRPSDRGGACGEPAGVDQQETTKQRNPKQYPGDGSAP
jgi:hypothetical protein